MKNLIVATLMTVAVAACIGTFGNYVEAGKQRMGSYKQLGLAIHNYHAYSQEPHAFSLAAETKDRELEIFEALLFAEMLGDEELMFFYEELYFESLLD